MPGRIHLVVVVAMGSGAAMLGAGAVAEAMLGHTATQAGAVIKNTVGRTVGTLSVQDENGRSKITVTATGLAAGYHGFHIHAKGVCDAGSTDPVTGSPFFSAGPHFNLGTGSHPNHSGDLPALLVEADGTGSASVVTDRFRVRQLLEDGGRAIIIHALPDNQSNIPARYAKAPDAETLKTGDSGARLACGVITDRGIPESPGSG
jgi:Cu-Zn family superoxide dismutase